LAERQFSGFDLELERKIIQKNALKAEKAWIKNRTYIFNETAFFPKM